MASENQSPKDAIMRPFTDLTWNISVKYTRIPTHLFKNYKPTESRLTDEPVMDDVGSLILNSREKFEPGPGFEPRISRSLVSWHKL